MPDYKAPIRDMKFVMQELLNCHDHYQNLGYEDATPDMYDAIINEGAKFVEQEIAAQFALCTAGRGDQLVSFDSSQ